MNTTILLYILCGFSFLLLIWNLINEYRLRKFFSGAEGISLEKNLHSMVKKMEIIESDHKDIITHVTYLDSKLKKSIRNVETVRFNPFLDQGGSHSFASAFVNDEGDGVIISGIFARDRVSTYAKPVKNGISIHELTDEEKTVLEKSLKS